MMSVLISHHMAFCFLFLATALLPATGTPPALMRHFDHVSQSHKNNHKKFLTSCFMSISRSVNTGLPVAGTGRGHGTSSLSLKKTYILNKAFGGAERTESVTKK